MTSLIDVLGDELSTLLSIKPIQAKGLLRLSIKDIMPEQTIDDLPLSNLIDIFQKGLKARLDNIGVPNSTIIINNLITFAKKNQSLITLLKT